MGFSSVGKFAFRGFGWFLKFKLHWFFIAFILINAFVVGISQGSFNAVVYDLGERFISPTYQLQQQSLLIIENGAEGFFSGFWDFLNMVFLIYHIFVYITLLGWIARMLILWDDSKTTSGYLIGILIFYVFQALYIVISKQGSIFDPIWAFRDFARAIPSLFGYFSDNVIGIFDFNNTNNMSQGVNPYEI